MDNTIRVTRSGISADDEMAAMKRFEQFLNKQLKVVRFVSIKQSADGVFLWTVTAEVEKVG